MKNKIKEVDIENEKVYLIKDILGWRVVNPIKTNGKFNWKNFILGNRKVIIFTIIWLLIMGFIFYGVNEMISSCKDMTKNPCKYFNINCMKQDSYFTLKGGDKNES